MTLPITPSTSPSISHSPARRLRALAALTASAAAVLVLAAPAHAAVTPRGPRAGGVVDLAVTKEGPVFGDDNALIYNIHLRNNGPSTATGLVLEVSAWYCPPDKWSAAECTALEDPNNASAKLLYDFPVNDLAPGQTDSFPVDSFLTNESAGSIRTTVEVKHVDQLDANSVPGACAGGWNPQPDCVSDVVFLSS